MTLPAYYILIFFIFGSLCPLLGVALGAWFVFRTKREPYEAFLPGKEKAGQAFNLAEEWEKEMPEATETEIPDVTKRAAERFRGQLATETPKVVETLEAEVQAEAESTEKENEP